MGFSETFKALSDPTGGNSPDAEVRADERGEIAAHFSITGASISHHLSVMRDCRAGAGRPGG